MKSLLIILSLCLLLALPALAEDALPQGVTALCDARYPAYIIACHDGWGNDAQGQYALVLTDGEDNILCIAEKAEGDAAYAFTVENTNAVREGAQLPFLLIDTGGDSLFYSYWDDDLYKTSYHSLKQNGVWGQVSLNYIDTSYLNYDRDIWVGVDSNRLFYDVRSYDKLENFIEDFSDSYMDIPVSPEFAENLKLAAFDVDMLSPEPGLIKPYPGLCAPLLEEGDELTALNVQKDTLHMLVKKADGSERLRLTAGWDESKNRFIVEETGPLPEDVYLDTWHGSARTSLHLCAYGGDYFNFGQGPDGKWRLHSVQSRETFGIAYNAVQDLENGGLSRNDGVVYGVSPWSADITQLDLQNLPRTFEEAAARLDTSAYAFVNNPNPADRLHLRTKPNKNAASLGKFYNRTPVYVLGTEGEWAHVRIGNETDGLEGYMMKKFLAFGSDKDSIACAFPQKFVKEELNGETGISKYPAVEPFRTITGFERWYVVGVHDDWYVILTPDGAVGYQLQSAFFDGNG